MSMTADRLRPLATVTGASSGIGAEFARQLASKYDLLLIARRGNRLRELANELRARGASASIIQADLAMEDELEAAARYLAAEPSIDLLVNAAGFGAGGTFWESPLEQQERMLSLHVRATMRLTHVALGNMVRRDAGAVISVASISAWLRRPGFIVYAATKSWIAAFTEGLYLDLQQAGSKVAVQALCPGLVYTEFHERMGVARERLGGPAFWQTPESVVRASLNGLRKRKLVVIPGWRYRALASVLQKLPDGGRLWLQTILMRGRAEALPEPVQPDV